MKFLNYINVSKQFRPNKNTCMKFHFIKRFKQRFKRDFSEDDYNRIVSAIKNSKDNVEFLYRQTNTKSVYKIKYMNLEFGVVYNKERKQLHTCFPLEWLNESNDILYF